MLKNVSALFILLSFNLAFAENQSLNVTLEDRLVNIFVGGELQTQVYDVQDLVEGPCYSGGSVSRKDHLHFKKSYSRHAYFYLIKSGSVFGIREDGSTEKESGENWSDLEDFFQEQKVCSVPLN